MLFDIGFYWCVWIGSVRTLNEFKLSYTVAHHMFPSVSTGVYSNLEQPDTITVTKWLYSTRSVQTWSEAKLHALMASPFGRTLFLDNDVYLARKDFMSSMQAIARISDIAMPIDPVRYMVPMGCSCMINYNTSRSKNIWNNSLSTLRKNKFPRYIKRITDQEAIWFTWTQKNVDASLRVFLIPEEYYCFWNKKRMLWKNQHKTYRCYAVHDHNYTFKILKEMGINMPAKTRKI